ncbi:hypothetical protein ACIQ34_02650 [Ureibacillus sp. NPDC094379]
MSENQQVLQAVLELSLKIDEHFKALNGRMDSLESRMGTLENRMDSLEEKLDPNHSELLGKINTINERLDTMDEKLGILANDTLNTKAEVKVLKKAMNMTNL